MRTYFTEKKEELLYSALASKLGQDFVDAVGMLFYKTTYSFLASKQGQDYINGIV